MEIRQNGEFARRVIANPLSAERGKRKLGPPAVGICLRRRVRVLILSARGP